MQSLLTYDIYPTHPTHARENAEGYLEMCRTYGLAAAIVRLAGYYVEARYRRIGILYWLINEPEDIRRVSLISRDLFAEKTEQEQFLERVHRLTARLLRGRFKAVVEIAKVVYAKGCIEYDDLRALLEGHLGEQPRLLAWLETDRGVAA